jgi:cell division protein FtsN
VTPKQTLVLAIAIVVVVALLGLGAYFLTRPSDSVPLPRQDPRVEEPAQPTERHYVQLSSHTTKGEARRGLEVHRAQLGDLLDGIELQVYEVVISGTTWYRIVFEVPTRSEAEASCQEIKSRGHDCLVYSFEA